MCLRVPGAGRERVKEVPVEVYVLVLSKEFARGLFITICRALVVVLMEQCVWLSLVLVGGDYAIPFITP